MLAVLKVVFSILHHTLASAGKAINAYGRMYKAMPVFDFDSQQV